MEMTIGTPTLQSDLTRSFETRSLNNSRLDRINIDNQRTTHRPRIHERVLKGMRRASTFPFRRLSKSFFNHIHHKVRKDAQGHKAELPSVEKMGHLATQFADLINWPETIRKAERQVARTDHDFDLIQHLTPTQDFTDKLLEIFNNKDNSNDIFNFICAIASHKGREELVNKFPEPNRDYARQLLKEASKMWAIKGLAIVGRIEKSPFQFHRSILQSISFPVFHKSILNIINKFQNTGNTEADKVALRRFKKYHKKTFELTRLAGNLAKVFGNIRQLQINEATLAFNKGLASARQRPVMGEEQVQRLKTEALNHLRKTLSSSENLNLFNYLLHQLQDYRDSEDPNKNQHHPVVDFLDQIAELTMPQSILDQQLKALESLCENQQRPLDLGLVTKQLDELWHPVQSEIFDTNDLDTQTDPVSEKIDEIKDLIQDFALDETSYVKFEHLLTLVECSINEDIFSSTRALMHLALENKIQTKPNLTNPTERNTPSTNPQLRLALEQLRVPPGQWNALKEQINEKLISLQEEMNTEEINYDENFSKIIDYLQPEHNGELTQDKFKQVIQVLDGVKARATLRNDLLRKISPALQRYGAQLSMLDKFALLLGVNETKKSDAFHPYPPYTQSNIFKNLPEKALLGLSNNIVNVVSNNILGISQAPVRDLETPEIRNEMPLPEVALKGLETPEDKFNRRLWGFACDLMGGTAEYPSEIAENPEELLYEQDLKIEAYAKEHNVSTKTAALHVREPRLSKQQRINLMRGQLKKNISFMVEVVKSGKLNREYLTAKSELDAENPQAP